MKEQHDKEYMDKMIPLIKEFSMHAVEHAKEFGKTLDFSDESINALEEILQHLHDDLEKKSGYTERDKWTMAMVWGCYLGEAMIKNKLEAGNWQWVKDESFPTIGCKRGILNPVWKVYKALTRNDFDSVESFYRIMSQMANYGPEYLEKQGLIQRADKMRNP